MFFRWSLIAGRLPGRTDNEIKNYWNSCLSKKLVKMGIDPNNHRLPHKICIHKTLSGTSATNPQVENGEFNLKSSNLESTEDQESSSSGPLVT